MLDCWDGKGEDEGEVIITHGKAMCTEVYFKVPESCIVLIYHKFCLVKNNVALIECRKGEYEREAVKTHRKAMCTLL